MSPIARFVTSLLGVLALATAGLAASAALGWVDVGTLVPAWLRPAPVVVAEPEPSPARASVPPSAPPVEKTEAQRVAEQLAQQIAEQTQLLAAASPAEDLERELQAQAAAKETEKRDRERREQIEADMAARALQRARDKVDIVMYSTSWCPVCTDAREYMTKRSIRFTEHDIEKNPSAREKQRRLNPKGSIPTIDVEGAVLVGFSGESLEQLIEAAAKKRVR